MATIQQIRTNQAAANVQDQPVSPKGVSLSSGDENSAIISYPPPGSYRQTSHFGSGVFSGRDAKSILAGKKGKNSTEKTEPDMKIASRATSPAEIKKALDSKAEPITLAEIDPYHRAGGVLEKTTTLSFKLDGQTTTVTANNGLFRTKDKGLIAIIKRRGIEGYKAISKPIGGMTYFVPENKAQEIEDALSGKKREQANDSPLGDYLGSL